MKRRDVLQALGSAGVAGLFSNALSAQTRTHTLPAFTVRGSGLATDTSPAGIASFTADRICADVLAVADAAGADRFGWFGFSFGSVVGLQLASRTNRLSALVCGGWPPLSGQYAETLAFVEAEAAQGRVTPFLTFYRSVRRWPEREAVSKFTCPRLAFAGNMDQFVAGSERIRIGPLVAEHRAEFERMGWTVQLIDGFGHELGGRPDVIVPILRRFLDPVLLPSKR